MKKVTLIFILCIVVLSCNANSQETVVIPLNTTGNKSLVTVRIGTVVIPDILLDTGFAFDGLMIYNPDYRDSMDLTNAIQVRIGGAGTGEASTALMLDSAAFSLGNIELTNQRIIVLQGDLYKGFPSNGLIGYSIFGHYITEFDYDKNRMILHTGDTIQVDRSWSEIPLYFKDNQIPWLDASVVIDQEEPVSLSMYIDYAAGDAVTLLEKSGMKFNLPEETEKVLLGRGLSGDIYGKKGTISMLIIGPYELLNVKACFAPAEVRSKQDNADAILGAGSLSRFNFILDYSNKMLFLKPNSKFKNPF